MEFTENLGLKKPGQDDFYDVDDFNYNAEILDKEVSGHARTDIYSESGVHGIRYFDEQLEVRDKDGEWMAIEAGSGDTITYDKDTSELHLKSGDKVLSSTIIPRGGRYIVFPEFQMDFATGHLSATGGAGVNFSINEAGHLESEVL